MNDPVENQLLTLSEAAQLLRVKVSTLRAWRAQRRLRFYKLSGKVLLKRGDVQAFIEGGAIPARKVVAQ